MERNMTKTMDNVTMQTEKTEVRTRDHISMFVLSANSNINWKDKKRCRPNSPVVDNIKHIHQADAGHSK